MNRFIRAGLLACGRARAGERHGGHQAHQANCESLCWARRGETACVLEVNGNEPQVARLRELGLREGACVEVVRDGDPLLVKVNGARFGIGRRAAMNILCSIDRR
jgi:Fe2+ transport system protein FeoA